MLAGQALAVLTTDPFVTTDPELRPLREVLERNNILILCAPHSIYRGTDFGGKLVFDVWGHLDGPNASADFRRALAEWQ